MTCVLFLIYTEGILSLLYAAVASKRTSANVGFIERQQNPQLNILTSLIHVERRRASSVTEYIISVLHNSARLSPLVRARVPIVLLKSVRTEYMKYALEVGKRLYNVPWKKRIFT